MMRRTALRLYPVGGPHEWKNKPLSYGPGKKWSVVRVEQEGPVKKDTRSITERGYVMKMIYMLQPITMTDLWEEVFTSPFNPIHTHSQLRNIVLHMRKDLQIYMRLDPDDLQFYIYMYPQWARLAKHYIGVEKKNDQEQAAIDAASPPPAYPPEPLRYYHQYLDHQEQFAQRRLDELESSGVQAVERV
eukprot:TRINITY_DN18534_c0_g1_i1.p1 TRINITY_DN18534_c0_g1~~TRINITY_DN18534_c0_g1_i1.p1  ORF type:complete len:188 (+),score=42.24 TRINITY_DN18534_c0_g1_i1:103-666(+)